MRSGAAPYGFAADAGELVPRREEQRAIEVMAKMRAAGESYRQIAGTLNARCIPPRRGERWYPMTVRRVLDRNVRTQASA